MPRAERFRHFVEYLGLHRDPARGAVLAGEAGVRLRTLYRGAACLQARGLSILRDLSRPDFGMTFVALAPDGHWGRAFFPQVR